MRDIVIWGASGHGKVVADALLAAAEFRIVGFIDDLHPERRGHTWFGSAVLGGRDVLTGLLAQGISAMAVAFGNNQARLRIGLEVAAMGFDLPVVVHPGAVVSRACELGKGTFVGAQAVVNADARLGRLVIVNSGAVVEHDCRVEDGVHVGPRACLTGDVRVGRCTWMGAGSVVREKLTIGADALVGMGAVVTRSLPDGVVAYGCPARIEGQVGKT